jgi:glycosyltransferase involved in cell wall biosynthesis
MRIVFATPSYYPCVGGAERQLQAVAERLVQRGHAVTVVTLDCATQRDFDADVPAGLAPSDTLNGVRIFRVDGTPGWAQRLIRWWLRKPGGWQTSRWLLGRDFGYWLGPPNGARMLAPLRRIDTDVISSTNWYHGTAFWAHRAAGIRGIPHVGVPVLHIAQEWAENPVYGRMLAAAAGVILNTDAERDFVVARGARVTTVSGGGVDPARFENADGRIIRDRISLGDRPVVGFVGRQDTTKGVPTLIEAMRRVWRRVPDAVLLLAGQKAHRSGSVTEKLQSLSATERENVVYVDDFTDEEGPAIMAACDILALPSVEESFGMVLIEAWACGKPVIAADIAATRCIVEPGIDGWLVKPFDAEDLAEKILRLLSSPEQRTEFGQRGREKMLARYTWEKVTDGWEEAFRKAVATSVKPGA